jgi:hypothetical protein
MTTPRRALSPLTDNSLPNSGCHGYSSFRVPVLWVLSASVVQLSASAPGARLPHAGRSVPAPVTQEQVIAMMEGAAPHTPRDLTQFLSRVDGLAFATIRDCRKMERLDRRIGQRRDATRAPTQARSGWRPSGRLLVSPLHHLRTAEILSKRCGPPQAQPLPSGKDTSAMSN